MNPPPTPPHPAPDAEISNLPHHRLLAADLDLNPGLGDDDDFSDSNVNDNPTVEDYNPEPANVEINSWTRPFDQAYLQEKHTLNNNTNHNSDSITESQQSSFINFMDAQFLQVQRRFIKNQAETSEIYPFGNLISDVAHLLNVIWYLVSPKTNLYGQEEYIIKLFGDLEDWVQFYDFPKVSDHVFYENLFTFFQSLDTKTAILMDGYTGPSGIQKLSKTQLVRLNPIVSRLRLHVVAKMDTARSELFRLRSLGDKDADSLLNVLDVEIGRMFEGVLERL